MKREQHTVNELIERALAGKHVEEQLAVSLVAKNMFNGASWEFCRMDPILRRYEAEFSNSSTCSLKRVTYHRQQGIQGYLVYMELERLLEVLGPDNEGPLRLEDIKIAKECRDEAKKELIYRIASGYQGKIGIYYTGDAGTIAVSGKTFPAYAITLKELCHICEKMRYGILIGGEVREARQVLLREDAVIESLLLAPSSNALFIDIEPK